jgi:hypothetical protein
MVGFNPANYGCVFGPLLEFDRRRALGEGLPNRAAHTQLEGLSLEAAFEHAHVVDRDMASCCISGVWLLHDFLDESHSISQSIETPSGSYWHAIMHRREGDFGNAKYWLRRVGRHPVFEAIGVHVAASLRDANASFGETRPRSGSDWDPFKFVDRCEAVARGHKVDLDRCLDVQQAEWELLFDHCYRTAIGE